MARKLVGVLEGQDAGKGDIAAERDAGARELAAGRKAVQNEGKGALPRFLLEDRRHVVVGVARMDHQRQAGLRARPRYACENPVACASRGDLS